MIAAKPDRRPTVFERESGRLPFEKSALHGVPDRAGLYLFLDAGGEIIYIGTAGPVPGLGHALREQFNSGLWTEVTHFKWAVTGEPTPAERLARSLIREFDPPFNRHHRKIRLLVGSTH